jgi:hypothetical protein
MFYWLYDIPVLTLIGLFALVFVGLCWLGTILISPIIAPRFHGKTNLNEVLGDYLQYFGVIYGLLLGLLAVATYQNHTDVEKAIASEASSLAALYRDISAYPEPDRSELKALIKEYTRSAIEDAWPLQRQGIDPGMSTGPRRCTQGWPQLSLRRKDTRLSTMRRSANSMISLRRVGCAFSMSPPGFHPSCGTRWPSVP